MIGWRKEKTGFALSGGGARGAAQVGMLRALLEAGVKPDYIVGTSVGAWNGAWLASDLSLERLDRLADVWRQITRASFNMVWWRAARNFVRRRASLYDGDGIARVLARYLGVHTFADLAIPLHVVAIDLSNGRKAVFSSGPLAPAVLASSAIPGVFPPITIDGQQFVDGGMVDPTGLETAVELGARRIYVLDSGYAGRLPMPLASMNAIVDHAFQIAAQHRTRWTIERLSRKAEIVHLRPSAGFLKHSMDFSHTDAYIDEGYRFTREALSQRVRHRTLWSSGPSAAPAEVTV